ncbi:signal transduction histidine kinase [Micromonospora sp. Llam0]|uniref:sensor histidine kinase n=1 Tax=Micromonospora sp. Llam0 TaxID=2485143 RepID=UPI000FB6E6EA|nr:sensor histidine kinase [Micromonospora sp. Llam0]ROO51136.1 signal transduction histidine kinase [Micromonospora sp. Llam0]
MRASTSGDTGPGWDRWYDRLLVGVPWLLLPASTAIALTQPGRTWPDHAITLGLVGATAGWVYLGHTRVPPDRPRRTLPMLIYFAGLLTLSVALMARDVIFLLFAITGFFHAYQLRPWPLGAAGVLGTSVVINTMATEAPAATVQSLGTYLGVIVIQTVAISAGIVLAERSTQQHERRQQLVARLEAALEENAGLHAQLLAQAREAGVRDERQRMAGEIHDSLAQGLTGIITQVQAAQRVWHSPTRAGEPMDRAREHVDRALALARESLDEARRSVQALQPRQLEAAHLPAALGDLARRWAADTGTTVRFDVTGEQVALSPAIDVILFRVAQESLHNVVRHADASRVGLTLSYLTDVVLLDVRDDGRGMNGGPADGFGLRSMVQRVRSVGGAMEIETAPGEGTAISVRVPAIPMLRS